MTHKNLHLAQPLGSCSYDVILIQYIQHFGTHETGNHSCCTERKRNGRQYGTIPASPESNRENAPFQTYVILKKGCGDKVRHRDSKHCQYHSKVINSAIVLPGSQDSQNQSDCKSDQYCLDTNQSRWSKTTCDNLRNILIYISKGGAQVSFQHVLDIFHILHWKRII